MHKIISVSSAVLLLFLLQIYTTNGLLRRCYTCRSRGELGSCKDPFTFNATDVVDEPGVTAIPCASGWCGKVMEGGGAYAVDDYDKAIQRMCVQRGPDDNQDRCAYTVFNYKKVFMCFCQGDLCNHAPAITESGKITLIALTLSIFMSIICTKIRF